MKPSELTKEHLANALSKEEFLFYYQPIVSLDTGNIDGAEALMRWQHNSKLIPPGDFIPFAEETGFITDITISMIPRCFEDLTKIHAVDESIGVSLNVSAKDITSPSFLEAFLSALEVSEFDADKIKLEITESAALTLDKEALLIVTELVAAGVRLSIDDFGTGDATFEKLKNLPFSILKIDRMITSGAMGSPDGLTLLDHSVNLSHQLKLDTIAEGVENEALFKYITTIGCEHIQGFLISQPLALSDFLDFIQEENSWEVSPIGKIYKAKIDYVDWVRRVFGILLIEDETPHLIDFDHTAGPVGRWLYSEDTEINSDNYEDLNKAYRKSHELAKVLINAKTNSDKKLVDDVLPDFLQATSVVNTLLHDIYIGECKQQLM